MTTRPSLASGSLRSLSPLLLALVLAPAPALSLGLGPAVQQSSLGQPLRLVVPITVAAGDEVSGDCFKLATAVRDADGVPQVTQARIVLERTPSGAQLVVTTPRAIDEPVIRVALQAGCENAVRRDYTLLLDPVPIDPPIAGVEPSLPVAPTAAATTEASLPQAAPSGTAARTAVKGPATRAVVRQRGAARRAAAGGPQADRPPRPRTKSGTAGAGGRAPPSSATAARRNDQLRISGPAASTKAAVPAGSGEAGASAAEIRARQDLALALEAETAVLQQRVTELSGAIERMEQELRAASAARLADNEAASATPPVIVARWWETSWPVIAAIVGLASVIAGGLLWRRRREPVATGEWPLAGLRANRFESSVMETPLPEAFTRTGDDAAPGSSPRAAPATPGQRAAGRPDAARAVAVSELSHVTEEARVYLAVNRADRAMEVLRRHIDEQPTTVPAAWLMLLDLYRSNRREQDFRQLAEDFHLHFNVQAPQWETFAGSAPDDLGLEAFPHLVEQLSAIWGTEDCRSFLERLLYDNRQGRRAGFSLIAYDDILTLRQVLEEQLADSDSHEEAKLRAAWAAAQSAVAPAKPSAAPTAGQRPPPPTRPITLDLELDLDEVVEASSSEITPQAPRRR
jgi:pilus assembly protein FimV